MKDFNYFKTDRVYNELFYQFPKVFIVSDKYKKMKDSTKIAYMLLKSRLEFAIKKQQYDEEGNIYFTYTISELCTVLNCQKQKAVTIKKELESFGLLLQLEMGFNKKLKKYNANRLYLAELDISENDIYQLQHLDTLNVTNQGENLELSEGMKIIPSKRNFKASQNTSTSEGMKIIPSKNPETSEGMKIIHKLNNYKPDTKEEDTTRQDTNTNDKLQIELLTTFHLGNDQSFLSERSLEFIAMYSKTIQQAHDLVGIILRAKKKAEIDVGKVLIADDWQEEIDLQIIKLVRKLKTDQTIQEPENYWFKTFYYFFQKCCLELKKVEETTPSISVTTHNWLE